MDTIYRIDSVPTDQTAINVLVVDDEAVIASEIIEFLSFEQIGAVAAKDGQQALHCLDAASPGAFTVMITDVRMPGINGLELASDIRAKASEANAIEVILMTGHGSHKLVQDATRIPAFECMAKPLSLSQLLTTIRRAHAATVVRRMNHRESIYDLLRLLEQAQILAARRPAPVQSAGVQKSSYPMLHPSMPDWRHDPLGFVLANENAALPGEPAATPAQRDWHEAVLDRAADQARTLLPAISPLTALILGHRPIVRAPVSLRAILDAVIQRHPPALLQVTAPTEDRIMQVDEQLLSAILDQVIDDVARSGPDAAPILIEVEPGEGDVTIRAIGCSTGPIVQTAHQATDSAAAVDDAPADTGGLGLRVAMAAGRLLGSTIERKGACNGYCTTAVIVSAAVMPTDFGVD